MSQSALPVLVQREYGRSDQAARTVERPESDGKALRGAEISAIDRIVVINDFSVTNGGCSLLALLSLSQFRDLGIPVTYICGDEGDPKLASAAVETVSLGGQSILTAGARSTLVKGIHNAGARAMIDRWIDAHDTPRTIYHVHGWAKILSPSIFLALARVADRTVIHAHDFFLACPNGAFYNYPSHSLCHLTPLSTSCIASQCDKRNYAQKLWRSARSARLRSVLSNQTMLFKHIVLIHEKMAPLFELAGFSPDVLHTLRNPVLPFTEERVRAEDNSEFFFIGRLDTEKGIEDAVRAAVDAGVTLNVIGDGPLAKGLAQMGPQVNWLGWLSHDEIATRVRTARAVILPTRYPEPFGLVALEASMSGIPVLMSDKAYLADEMVAAGTGIACDTSDPAAFAEKLRDVACMSRDAIQQMSMQAFDGTAKMATTPDEWRDGLIGRYGKLLNHMGDP
jgi:glycosyltransferase involved in cell wall biosynthesis